MAKKTVPTPAAAIACEICLKEIPKSVARSHEGPDYVHYFCGDTCFEQWQGAPAGGDVAAHVSGVELDLDTAKRIATLIAQRRAPDALLVAWYDARRGQASPDVPECTSRPGWLAYAEGHGGKLKVDINDGEYTFAFAAGK